MFRQEVSAGQRFEFGANWLRFLRTMNDERLAVAERAIANMLGDIRDKSFLDVGCGSGLSSLAAHRLGAKVRSFDYDPKSVACTKELQKMYGASWPAEEGSALDAEYLKHLGQFDIVYSWGVLHHTGKMWEALGNVVELVKPGGVLFVAIYNDQGWKSRAWRSVKSAYNRSPVARLILVGTVATFITASRWLLRALTGRLKLERGMSLWHDAVDWIGGYPFEVASADSLIDYYVKRGFSVHRTRRVGRRAGCNEFVFRADHNRLDAGNREDQLHYGSRGTPE